MWVMTTASMSAGLTPAAANAFGSLPAIGPAPLEYPVSTRINLSPVLISHSLKVVGAISLLATNAASSSLAAPSASPEKYLVGRAAEPSLRTVTSIAPIFIR